MNEWKLNNSWCVLQVIEGLILYTPCFYEFIDNLIDIFYIFWAFIKLNQLKYILQI